MPTENSQNQAPAARVERSAQRVEQGVQSATQAAIDQVRDVRERAESGIEQQRTQVVGRVRRLGDALRQTSDQLSSEDPFAQNLLDRASERVERVAAYLDHAGLQDVTRDLQSFARRQPGVFFGGAFLVGLAIGRFAKSSSSPRSERLAHDEPELPQRARSQMAQRYPGYDQSRGEGTRSLTSSSPSAVGTSATGVSYAAPSTTELPTPQPSGASTQPHIGEPGRGTKS